MRAEDMPHGVWGGTLPPERGTFPKEWGKPPTNEAHRWLWVRARVDAEQRARAWARLGYHTPPWSGRQAQRALAMRVERDALARQQALRHRYAVTPRTMDGCMARRMIALRAA